MKHNFKVGDKVKVVKKVKKQEGWDNTWYDEVDCGGPMSNSLNKEYTIENICGRGISFIEDASRFYFPSDSLELVTNSTETKELLTEADVIQALLAGEILIDSENDKYYLDREEPRFYYIDHDNPEPSRLLMTAKDILYYKPKIYKEVIEKPWYENIPEQGRLCWISDKEENEKIIIDAVTTYLAVAPRPFICRDASNWKYATPLTNEEIKQFLQVEE